MSFGAPEGGHLGSQLMVTWTGEFEGSWIRRLFIKLWAGAQMLVRARGCFVNSNSKFGLPRWLSGKESAHLCRRQRCEFDPWVGKIPWRRKWQAAPIFLSGESHGQRGLVGCSLSDHKKLDATEYACMRVKFKNKIKFKKNKKKIKGWEEVVVIGIQSWNSLGDSYLEKSCDSMLKSHPIQGKNPGVNTETQLCSPLPTSS